MRPRNLYILGMILTFLLSLSEVMRGREKNFMIFSESTRLFWGGIMPYGDNLISRFLKRYFQAA
jgi:hypothetical protein